MQGAVKTTVSLFYNLSNLLLHYHHPLCSARSCSLRSRAKAAGTTSGKGELRDSKCNLRGKVKGSDIHKKKCVLELLMLLRTMKDKNTNKHCFG